MRLCNLSLTYTCRIGPGASNALTATADVAPVYVYGEEAEPEYITEVMRRKSTDKEPAAKYNHSSRKESMRARYQGYTVTRATDRVARGKGALMTSWLVNGLRGAKAVSAL